MAPSCVAAPATADTGSVDAPLAHLAAACAYAGFQWTVRVVVYPQLAAVGHSDPWGFPAYAVAHQRRVTWLVGPLFAALVTTSAVLVATRPTSVLAWACAAATLVVLGATWLGAVPCHRVLGAGWDGAAHRRLLRADGVRVAASSAQVVCALLAAAG